MRGCVLRGADFSILSRKWEWRCHQSFARSGCWPPAYGRTRRRGGACVRGPTLDRRRGDGYREKATAVGMSTIVLLALLDSAWGHVDITLLPCDPHDQMQLWTMPARGMGYGGTLSHQSTKLCLMPQGCDVDEGTPLVLDDCASSCASSHPDADTFTLHHPSGANPRALELSKSTPRLFASASSSAPFATLAEWDTESPDHQEWTSALPYQGPDHILQVGTGKDGKALCDAPSGACCLGAQHDVLPDGDGGWVLIVALAWVAALYVFGGVYLGHQRTGRYTHLHIEQGKQVLGLVKDGCDFTMAALRGEGGRRTASGADERAASGADVESASADASSSIVRATRGQPTPLHHAASVGDSAKLRKLLAAGASVDINSGDTRQYTAFATACAGGHAECVSALLEAGCDTQLACDTGLTGWELAKELKRHDVLALQLSAGSNPGGNRRAASKKRSSSVRSSSSKHRGSAVDERAAPLLPTGGTTVVL